MKVSELKKGMMLIPSVNKYTKKRPALILRSATMKKFREDNPDSKTAVACRISPRFYSSPAEKRHDFCIYIGCEKSDYLFDGVRTHHMLLVGGSLARITGYEFRYLEPTSECN